MLKDDLLRDLDKELKAWSSSRPPKTGGGAKSLWEELEAIGEVRLRDGVGLGHSAQRERTRRTCNALLCLNLHL